MPGLAVLLHLLLHGLHWLQPIPQPCGAVPPFLLPARLLLCSTMARPGTPGDELMLRAVADHFGVPINICTSDPFM